MKTSALPLFLAFGFVSLAAQGGTIFDNGGPDPTEGWPYSDFAFPQQMADNFQLVTGSNVIRDIHWWGAYGSGTAGPAEDTFTIRIFQNASDRPSATVYETAVFSSGLSRELIENPDAPFYTYYEYAVAIAPITLNVDTTYWLSIVNDTEVGNWVWALSAITGGNLAFRQADSESWNSLSWSQAFYLTDDVQVPEPATLALMCLGIAGIGYRRRTPTTA